MLKIINRYTISFSKNFLRRIKVIYKKDRQLYSKYVKVVEEILEDPFTNGVKTHLVGTVNYGRVLCSRVTGDIRIIWCMETKKKKIILLDIGGHEGSHKVYK